tara:strand:+ start:28 stop:1311 length:1284 start_codon:yes stop_codon:yes gene_type:complete
MAKIDKLISKFNKVKSKINSIKGIAAKIEAINYKNVVDTLGGAAAEAESQLKHRQESLNSAITDSKGKAAKFVKSSKLPEGNNYVYPYHDPLANYIVFDILPRIKRNNSTNTYYNTSLDGKDDKATKDFRLGGGGEVYEETSVYKRNSISLYVPDALISQATTQYRPEGISAFNRAIASMIEAAGSGGADFFDTGMEQGKKLFNKVINESLNKMSGGLLGLRAGRASNPQQEQMLDGIPMRSWDFTFDFWPKSAKEAEQCRMIIETFRQSMLPDTYSDEAITSAMFGEGEGKEGNAASINASYFNYPNIFHIYYHGPMASKVDGFLPAVCTNAQVDYTGGQKFTTYHDGMPVHMQLTLNFLEIKTMSLGNYNAIKSSAVDGNVGSTRSMYGDSTAYIRASRGQDGDITTAEAGNKAQGLGQPGAPKG